MSDTFSKVEVITGVARRRRFSTDLKLAVVAETMQPGMSISYVARRHGLSPSLVFRWRRLMSEGGREAVRADDEVVPPPSCAGWKSGCAISNGCSAARPWRTRSSRRLSNWRGQKNRSCCRALCRRTVPDEDGHRHAGPGAFEHCRARQGRAPEARATDPRRRPRTDRRDPPPCRRATDLRVPADRRAPQARAASRRHGPGQRQAGLPADEAAWLAAGSTYRPATPARA